MAQRGKTKKIEWKDAPDIQARLVELIEGCGIKYVDSERVICYRSQAAKTRAFARIWGLSRIWQQALSLEPAYVLEVVSEKFDSLPQDKQDMILIHELLHIPKNFSGALLAHRRKGGVDDRVVREVYSRFSRSSQKRTQEDLAFKKLL